MADESKAAPDDIAFAKTLPPTSDDARDGAGGDDDATASGETAAAAAGDKAGDDTSADGGLIDTPTLAPPGYDDEDDIGRAPTGDHDNVALANARTDIGTPPKREPRDDALHNLLAALVEQARALASRIAGDPERANPCHFCGGPLALWENLLVLQLAGVPAHVACPPSLLEERLASVGPSSEFGYADLSAAVDRRVEQARPPDAQSGTIDIA